MNSLLLKALVNIPEINPGTDIADIIFTNIQTENISVKNGDIFVIAQKIISKAENRYIKLSNIEPSNEALSLAKEVDKTAEFIQVILDESNKIISSTNNMLITEHRLGFTNINAGIDQSNIPQKNNLALLLPKDPSNSAKKLGISLSKALNKNISVIISDSMTRPVSYTHLTLPTKRIV